MYDFNPLGNGFGHISPTYALDEMHYIDQTHPANHLDEFLSGNSFDPQIFTGANKRLVSEYVDRFIEEVKTACNVLGKHRGMLSCIGSSHIWGYGSFARDAFKFTVKLARSKVTIRARISEVTTEYILEKDGKTTFDREEINRGVNFFSAVINEDQQSYLNNNCFKEQMNPIEKIGPTNVLLSKYGLVMLNARVFEGYRNMIGKFGEDFEGFTREVIITVTGWKFQCFQDHMKLLESMGLMRQCDGLYFYNHEAMKAIRAKMETIDYFAVNNSNQNRSDFSGLERIYHSKVPVMRAQLTASQMNTNKKAAERGKAHIEFYHKEGDAINQFTCRLSPYGELIYQTYVDIYKIIESYVLRKKTSEQQLEVA